MKNITTMIHYEIANGYIPSLKEKMKQDKLNERLHWTTTITEKVMLGGIGCLTIVVLLLEVWGMGKQKYRTC